MNQRSKRARDRKNKVGFATMNTGGHTAHHSRDAAPEVQVPAKKVTGDVKGGTLEGLAKASKFFKEVVSKVPKTRDEEKKTIAANKVDLKKTKIEEKEKEDEEK